MDQLLIQAKRIGVKEPVELRTLSCTVISALRSKSEMMEVLLPAVNALLLEMRNTADWNSHQCTLALVTRTPSSGKCRADGFFKLFLANENIPWALHRINQVSQGMKYLAELLIKAQGNHPTFRAFTLVFAGS